MRKVEEGTERDQFSVESAKRVAWEELDEFNSRPSADEVIQEASHYFVDSLDLPED